MFFPFALMEVYVCVRLCVYDYASSWSFYSTIIGHLSVLGNIRVILVIYPCTLRHVMCHFNFGIFDWLL